MRARLSSIPAVASKLGLLHPIIASRVLLFYTALHAIDREIEDAKNDFPRDEQLTENRKSLWRIDSGYHLTQLWTLLKRSVLVSGTTLRSTSSLRSCILGSGKTNKPLRAALIEAIEKTPAPFAPPRSKT
jgi:hypothetical protein